MRGTQITIKDIARELGVSPSTVSRALKDHPDISLATRLKVKQLAEEYGYKPNAIALSLLQSKTNIIGVIIPEIVHFFFSSVISGIEEVAHKNGYQVMICQSNESVEREKENVQTMIKGRVDGVLISISKQTQSSEHLQLLDKAGIPMVFFDRSPNDINSHQVIIDDEEGAFSVVNHLIQQGYKRIMHLAGPDNLVISQRRLAGYKRALKQNGLNYNPELIQVCDQYDDAIRMVPKLLQRPTRPDAIFAVNDLTAVGAIKVIREMGLKIPQDIGVAGFTNEKISSILTPSLTSVEQHGFSMGEEAAKLLMKRFETNIEDYVPETKIIPSTLIIRESTKK